MNTKNVINGIFLEQKEITVKELYDLLLSRWTGKVKIVKQSPTTAGINYHLKIESPAKMSYDHDVIRIDGDNFVICFTKLTSANYEDMNGRPVICCDNNGEYTHIFFT